MSGQYAVAHVVINRVQSDKYPSSVCSVVKQGYSNGRHKCQFSWFCDGKSDTPREKIAWAWSLLVADDVLRGNSYDETDNATHYHALYVKPYWADSLKVTGVIGSHIFYKQLIVTSIGVDGTIQLWHSCHIT